jgi:hypothetical protein
MNSTNWFEIWSAADRLANEAIRGAARKSMLALDRLGEPPSQEETQELKRLCSEANAVFHHALAAMKGSTGAGRGIATGPSITTSGAAS